MTDLEIRIAALERQVFRQHVDIETACTMLGVKRTQFYTYRKQGLIEPVAGTQRRPLFDRNQIRQFKNQYKKSCQQH